MNNIWKTIDEFSYETEAQPLIDMLKERNIPYQILYTEKTFNPSFLSNQLLEKIIVNVPEQYYAMAYELWQKMLSESEWYDIYPHYLDEFSEEELYTVVENPDLWSSFDVNYAKNLLEKIELKKKKENGIKD
jgi:hypothetical protein